MNPCHHNVQQRRQHTNIAASLWAMPAHAVQQQLQHLAQIDACGAHGVQQALEQLRHSLLEA